MKHVFLIICSIFIGITVYGQIENPSGNGFPINAVESKTTNNSLILGENKGLSNTKSYLNSTPQTETVEKKEENKWDMTTDHGLLTKKFEYKPSWLTKDTEILEAYRKDQNLGEFSTESKTVEILCRDNQYVDGDKVRIMVNDKVIVHTIHLREDFQVFEIDLEPGNNLIQFQALNQGSSGPNTAHFKVYDKNGLVTESEWNLLTGAKGNLVILQESF